MSGFKEALDRFSDLVDRELERLIAAETAVPNLHDALRYSLGLDMEDRNARGKRIRPVLCLACAEALGGDVRRALPFAASIELMHNFALVHDDIEDGDKVRRGRPATWVHYGLPHGVNVGSYFACKVLSALLDSADGLDDALRLRFLRLMSDTLDHTHVGQCLDINARRNRSFTVADYLAIVREKTGFYLAAPMLGGAIAAAAGADILEALTRFGHAMGPLFQIRDDVIDLTVGKGRDAIGSDIREGKRSYLVAAALERSTEAEREQLYDILDRDRDATTDADIQWTIELFRRTGAFDQAEAYGEALREEGLRAIVSVPTSLRTTLTEAAEMLARRNR